MNNTNIQQTEKNKESIILSLIQNDLRTSCLVTGLDSLGLDAVKYHLTVSDCIFKLLGIKPEAIDEHLLDVYCEEIGKGAVTNIVSSPQHLEQKALEILEVLKRYSLN